MAEIGWGRFGTRCELSPVVSPAPNPFASPKLAALLVCAFSAATVSGCSGCAPVDREPAGGVLAIWESPLACSLAPELVRTPGHHRVGTWNVRWFPDGTFENEDGDDATDVGWLACAIARLDVDVLAVQEFKTHARARRAQSELLTELDELTGGAWALVLDDCPHDNQPHQGFLYDQTKVHVSAARDLPELNPHEGACGGAQRPGMAVEVTFDDGVEVVLVNVHTKSGTRPEDRKLRIDSFDTMASVHRDEVASTGIDDVVFLGDFNTNGCPDCSEPLTANAEVWDLSLIHI